jgi:hypothetical protein
MVLPLEKVLEFMIEGHPARLLPIGDIVAIAPVVPNLHRVVMILAGSRTLLRLPVLVIVDELCWRRAGRNATAARGECRIT